VEYKFAEEMEEALEGDATIRPVALGTSSTLDVVENTEPPKKGEK